MVETGYRQVWSVMVRVRSSVLSGSMAEMLSIDVPCGRCALSLRGRHSTGQCPECGMDISKSLSVAAQRSEDPAQLEQIASGLRTQAWGTVLSLLACVCGPLVLRGTATVEAFVFASAVALSAIAALQLAPFDAHHRIDDEIPHSRSRRWFCGLVMAMGGAVMVLPALLLSTSPVQPVARHMLVLFLAGAAVWFIGECLKLRILENCAAGMPGRELVRRARNLRIGAYAATALLAVGVIPATAQRPVTGAYLVTGSVALLVLTMLSALLYSRTSRSIYQRAAFARHVRKHLGIVEPSALPDEPDWKIEMAQG